MTQLYPPFPLLPLHRSRRQPLYHPLLEGKNHAYQGEGHGDGGGDDFFPGDLMDSEEEGDPHRDRLGILVGGMEGTGLPGVYLSNGFLPES